MNTTGTLHPHAENGGDDGEKQRRELLEKIKDSSNGPEHAKRRVSYSKIGFSSSMAQACSRLMPWTKW